LVITIACIIIYFLKQNCGMRKEEMLGSEKYSMKVSESVKAIHD
jgi:hypothetical protein